MVIFLIIVGFVAAILFRQAQTALLSYPGLNGLILGVLNVFVRDIGQVVPILLQVWFWFTPVVYPANIIPERFRSYMDMNPMYPIVTAYHDILVYAKTPDIQQIAVTTVIALGLMLLGLFMFRRAAPEMVDVL